MRAESERSSRTHSGRGQSPALQKFSAKVQEFAGVRDRVEKQLAPLPEKAEAEILAARRNELTTAVQKVRGAVREGDMFTPAVRAQLAKIIASEMRGPDGKPARDAAKQGNPKFEHDASGAVKIVVNAIYPEAAPRSAMPSTLLLRLPALPDEVTYRFVGPDLVLIDSKTALVVDVFRRAAPSLAATKK